MIKRSTSIITIVGFFERIGINIIIPFIIYYYVSCKNYFILTFSRKIRINKNPT